MRKASKVVARWLAIKSEHGVTAIEYGLIASLVALAIIVGATLLGVNLNASFNYIAGLVEPPSSDSGSGSGGGSSGGGSHGGDGGRGGHDD